MKEEFVDHNFKSLVTRLEAKFPEVKKVTSKKSVDENQLGLL